MSQEPAFVVPLWVFVFFVFQPRARMLSRPQMPRQSGFESQRTHCSFTAKTAMIAKTIAKGIAKGIALLTHHTIAGVHRGSSTQVRGNDDHLVRSSFKPDAGIRPLLR
jgi:hypothetical protein